MIIWVIQLRNVDDEGRSNQDVLGCALSVAGAEALVATEMQTRLLEFKQCRLFKEDGSIQLAYCDGPFPFTVVSARPHIVYDQVSPWLAN
jgi:hypothetical protein